MQINKDEVGNILKKHSLLNWYFNKRPTTSLIPSKKDADRFRREFDTQNLDRAANEAVIKYVKRVMKRQSSP